MKGRVIGTGCVGLLNDACPPERGNDILCADVDERKIRLLKNDKFPIHEPGVQDMVL